MTKKAKRQARYQERLTASISEGLGAKDVRCLSCGTMTHIIPLDGGERCPNPGCGKWVNRWDDKGTKKKK